MATFEERVEGLTGLSISVGSPTQNELTEYLNDGVIDVTDRTIKLRPDEIESFTRESSEQTSNGFNPGTNKIFSVIRESGTNGQWYPCTKKHISLQYKVTDVESLEYASQYNPVFMITQNRNVHVYPVPGSSNNGFKVLYVNTSPENGSGNPLIYSSSTIKWFPNDKVYLVVLYASIKSLENALSGKASDLPRNLPDLVLETTSESLPTYTAPNSFVMPVAPIGVDVDFSSVESISTYVPPIFSAIAPEYVAPVISPDYADANTWINTEEDDEMSAARMQVINAQINQYATEIQDANAKMSKENLEYQGELSLYSSNIEKEVRRVAASVKEFESQVGKALEQYKAETGYDIAKYQMEIQAETQRFQNDLQDSVTTFDKSMEKYEKEFTKVTSKNQALIGKHNIDVQNYTSQLGKVTKDYEWMTSRMLKLQQEYDNAFMIMQPKQQRGEG